MPWNQKQTLIWSSLSVKTYFCNRSRLVCSFTIRFIFNAVAERRQRIDALPKPRVRPNVIFAIMLVFFSIFYEPVDINDPNDIKLAISRQLLGMISVSSRKQESTKRLRAKPITIIRYRLIYNMTNLCSHLMMNI